MNVCPLDVTDILRALLWSPLDESSGREHTLTPPQSSVPPMYMIFHLKLPTNQKKLPNQQANSDVHFSV